MEHIKLNFKYDANHGPNVYQSFIISCMVATLYYNHLYCDESLLALFTIVVFQDKDDLLTEKKMTILMARRKIMTTLDWTDWSGIRRECLVCPVVQMSAWTVGSMELSVWWSRLVKLVNCCCCWRRSTVDVSKSAICIVNPINHPVIIGCVQIGF